MFNPVVTIKKKRNGEPLDSNEINAFVGGFTDGSIPDYQMSALLMSIYFKGMSEEETALLTKAMLQSGKSLDLSNIQQPKVDKHSTGGVGDKTSIILAPLLASVGVTVPMISGRGLGHTGGTIDKLESIPGFHTNIPMGRFEELLRTIGVGIIAQSEEICPADKSIYALRDVSATVDSIPLIVASIMSKKLAEDFDGLVMDIKTGSGAFMKTPEEALALAHAIVSIGEQANKNICALLTDMSQPLGRTVGNSIEINECVSFLRCGPEDLEPEPRLFEVTMALAVEMFLLAEKKKRKFTEAPAARKILEEALRSGRAYSKFLEFVSMQKGDTSALDYGLSLAKTSLSVDAPRSGYITQMHTESIGMALVELGGGRLQSTDSIDPSVGFYFHHQLGDKVSKGGPMVAIYATTMKKAQRAKEQIQNSISIGSQRIAPPKLIQNRIVYERANKRNC